MNAAAPEPQPSRETTRALRHAAIRKTVERMAPLPEIDTTRVLTDEEMRVLQEQTAKHMKHKKLAEQEGREGLMERVKRAAEKINQTES